MPIRLKKLIGTVLLIVLVILYALIATTVAVSKLADAGPAMHLAFPYGDWSPEVAAAAVAAGYNHLWTVEPKPVASGPSGDGAGDLLGRVTVDADDWPIEYRLKTAGSYRWIAWFMTAKRRRASAVARTAASGG